MEKSSPERSETREEKNDLKAASANESVQPEPAFRRLTAKLLKVLPEEIKEKEREWKERHKKSRN